MRPPPNGSRGQQRVRAISGPWLGGLFGLLALCGGCGSSESTEEPPEPPEVGDDDSAEFEICDRGEIRDHAGNCVPAACGYSNWGDLDTTETTVYVDASAETGGDGSIDAPFDTIQQGADAAGDAGGGLVAVAAGTYAESVLMYIGNDGVHLAGRCPQLVTISGGDDPYYAAIWVSGTANTSVEVSGLTIRGSHGGGIDVLVGELTVSDVDAVDNEMYGVFAGGELSRLVVRDAIIRESRPDNTGWGGWGVYVYEGGTVEIENSEIHSNKDVGVLLLDSGTEVYLDGVTVHGTFVDNMGLAGYGLYAGEGARLVLDDSVVEGNTTVGLVAMGPGTSVSISNSQIVSTLPDGDGDMGIGLFAEDRVTLDISGSVISGNSSAGIKVSGPDSVVTVSDTQFLDTQNNDSWAAGGHGLDASGGVWLSATSLLFQRNTYAAVELTGMDVAATFDDVRIEDTCAHGNQDLGLGVVVRDGADLHASSLVIERSTTAGVLAIGEMTEVTLVDCEIRDTYPPSSAVGGYGVQAYSGADLNLTSCLLERNTVHGMSLIDAGTRAYLEDVEVRETRSDDHGNAGVGIYIGYGASLEAEGATFEGNEGVGVHVAGPASSAFLGQSLVSGTTMTSEQAWGFGVAASAGGVLDLVDTTIEDSTSLGAAALGNGSTVILEDVSITGTRRGAVTVAGVGGIAMDGGDWEGTNVTVEGTEGPGLLTTGDGSVSCTACDLVGNGFAGAVGWGGDLEIVDSSIRGVTPDASLGGGVGVFVLPGDTTTNELSITGTEIEESTFAAVWFQGEGSCEIQDSTLYGGSGYEVTYPNGDSDTLWGDAVVAIDVTSPWDGQTGLSLTGNTVRDGQRCGILLHHSTATLSGNTYLDNPTDLVIQHCDGVDDPTGYDEASTIEWCPAYDHALPPLDFEIAVEQAPI